MILGVRALAPSPCLLLAYCGSADCSQWAGLHPLRSALPASLLPGADPAFAVRLTCFCLFPRDTAVGRHSGDAAEASRFGRAAAGPPRLRFRPGLLRSLVLLASFWPLRPCLRACVRVWRRCACVALWMRVCSLRWRRATRAGPRSGLCLHSLDSFLRRVARQVNQEAMEQYGVREDPKQLLLGMQQVRTAVALLP